ncbi:hypothetical protein RZN05_03415 [Sphingomonas sp. HF-S4]|uniref:Uncharacterized protein n=1 Tax=Sphingomonas agrestis TaxID=3080540 RepID=A0ABU3Y3M6_9SPHN|nr:hypothetical protein [Sphingomonas sp. HF-S4]MDV3456017.1 hypothetical protein [Sphingomonas sp. HF-S4]
MRARLLIALLYPLGLVVGQIPMAEASIGRWCGSGPAAPARGDPNPLPCHAILGCDRKSGRR